MKRTVWLALVASLIFLLAGCSENQVQASVPEIEFIAHAGHQYPQLKVLGNDEIINIINTEIEVQFQQFIDNRKCDDAIRSLVSSNETIISILLKTESNLGYGTDGEIWGICYDYGKKTIIPCGTYLSWLGFSYADICQDIKMKLNEDGLYEYISVPYCYFDENSNPVLVVIALEHPIGADSWKRIYYYSPVSNSFINSPWTT